VTEGAWKIGEGDKAQEWWNTIPEPEAREHVKAKGYKNPAELALANYSLTKMQRGSTDVLSIPGKDAGEDAWNDFYTKVGRPATKDDYALTFGEGVKTDPKMIEFGKEIFYELGARPEQAQKAANKWNEFVAAQTQASVEAEQAKNTQALQALEQEWGPQLNEHRAAGQRVMEALKLDEATMNEIQGAIGAAPLVKLLAMIGKKSGEGTLVGGQGGGDPNDPASMSKDQANAKIATLNADMDFQKKYTDKNHPEHKEAVDLMAKLYARS
jgi:hypothetical protein